MSKNTTSTEKQIPLMFFNAKASQGNKMPMVQPGKKFNFSAELILPLLRDFVHPFYCCDQAIRKMRFIHSSKSPLTNHSAKILCSPFYLLVVEFSEHRRRTYTPPLQPGSKIRKKSASFNL